MTSNGANQALENDGNIGGYSLNHADGVARVFLSTGDSFEDLILRAGLPMDDAMMISSLYRKGITFRVPAMVIHAQHALIAAAAKDGDAKYIALASVIGKLPTQPNGITSTKPLLNRFLKKGKKGSGNDTVQGA